MSLFSRIFRSRKKSKPRVESSRVTTVENPFCMKNPTIGYLNLLGATGKEMLRMDQQLLSPLFIQATESNKDVPSCSVLFLYCDIDASGTIIGCRDGVRRLIKTARAHLAIVASENPPEHYMRCLGPRNDWGANIVLTIERKGERFPKFFAELFQRMYAGTSMPMAWVELAPQIPGHGNPNSPSTIMVAEAGHLVFAR